VIDVLDVSKYVEITFEAFDLQHPNNSNNDCTYAYLELRDYPLGENGQVIRYCSSSVTATTPDDFFSFEQVVQVNLRTDLITTGAGFTLRYKATSCSRKVTKPYAQLYSPGWPNPYPANLNCETTIEVEDGMEIQIFCSAFDVEFTDTCAYDYMEIRNGTDISAPVIMDKTCGSNLPNPVFVKSNKAYIHLVTDPYLEGVGYDITYTSSLNSCGGNVSGEHGVIFSRYYPQVYEPNWDCDYVLKAPTGRIVTVHLTYIDIYVVCDDAGCRCIDDAIYIYDGDSRNAPYIAGYCGTGSLRGFVSSGNAATIRFITGNWAPGSRTNTGFRVDYET
jgi:cubilin